MLLFSVLEKCWITEVRGYLKMECYVNGTKQYRCTHSNVYYQVKDDEFCEYAKYTNVCDNDPGFYQQCGHVNCKEYQIQKDLRCVNFRDS